ncbi:MAG: hypothetical protein E6K81_04220 [Candidatus Eisenbacteria bacterium]|uniref:Tail specific protease domain-containing protein n=1 Tax=Eiseniibacteriota bacterium TaxID=2212470 RepID=A0A538UCE6_UNCEI|nr:MAG: hypothetical protein E6K81_04220 [Candidatus Eisenbacteria bacterium]
MPTAGRVLLGLAVIAALLVGTESHAFDAGAAFDHAWTDARDHLYDAALAARFFTEADRLRLRERLRSAPDIATLADSVNDYLDQLHVSHTRMVTPDDLEFYLYASMWSPRQLDTLEVFHIGIQWERRGNATVVTGLLEGYPAERAGLRRGDVIVSAGGQAFQPLRSFAGGGAQVLTVRRGLRSMVVRVQPVFASPMRSMLEAMRASLRRIDLGTHRVGYLHVWTCLSPVIEEEFQRLVRDSLATADGIVLDLRGGTGGDWLGFLDPFFPDRAGYAAMTVTGRAARAQVVRPDPLAPHPCYAGPLVALIDEGTRSGKEAIAFELKRAKRARLVGVTTAGAFRGGQFYADREQGYILIVALNHLLLDGQDLEGRGVAPDVEVGFPLEGHAPGDPQLERALLEMRRRLGTR